jgi:hypothetical protein
MLFRLICTAIATPLRSETYHALHHRITIFTYHRTSRRVIHVSLCQCLRIEHYFCISKQYTEGVGLLLASKQSEIKCSPTTTNEISCYHHKQTTSTQSSGLCHAAIQSKRVSNNNVSNNGNIISCHSLDVIRVILATNEVTLIS